MFPAVIQAVLDIMYPAYCDLCGDRVNPGDKPLCWECTQDIRLIQTPYCRRCGDPVSGRIDHEYTCHLCSSRTVHFSKSRSAAYYDGTMKRMVYRFKYRNALWLRPVITEYMHAAYLQHFEHALIDGLCPVPLYFSKKRARGYNQAELLTRSLSLKTGKPMIKNCLRRIIPTQTQTRLTAEQRVTNVRGAFSARKKDWIKGRRLMLVDDVMTTGATVNECARVLKEAGAADVYVLTAARGF